MTTENYYNENSVKFLIIRFSSIGDIVLTSPVIRCLKQQVDNAEVHYLTKEQNAKLLTENPYIDKILTLKSFQETVDEIREECYDYIIDLHHNLRTWRLKNKLKILDFSFPKLNWEKWILVNFKIDKLPDIHIVDRYLSTVDLFDVQNDNKGLDFFINEENEVNIEDVLGEKNQKFVAVAIGGQHFTKKMPAELLQKIVSEIHAKVILLGGKEDFDNGEIIKNNSENIINTCGKYSIQQSASIIKQSSFVITHDTGLMHIAAAFKKIIISIWGNTVPKFGMYPYMADPKSKIFEVNSLKCRPCTKIGFSDCPKKHFNCMKNQDISEIINYSEILLK